MKNLVPVYLRVWYDYANFTKATGNWVRLQDWDKTQMKVNGNSLEVDTINTQLEGLQSTFFTRYLTFNRRVIILCGLQPPPSNWTVNKKKEYLEESQIILEELRDGNRYLAKLLKAKIPEYRNQNKKYLLDGIKNK